MKNFKKEIKILGENLSGFHIKIYHDKFLINYLYNVLLFSLDRRLKLFKQPLNEYLTEDI